MKYTKERIDAINAYNKEHMTQFCIKFNKTKESDMIEHILWQPSKSGYIKRLIREDMERQ